MTTVYVTHPRYPEHTQAGHPEHAGRIHAIWQELDHSGLSARMQRIIPEPISLELISRVHTQDYINILQWISSSKQRSIALTADTYAQPASFEIARLAAGGVVQAVNEVASGRAHNGLAAVRPPGHHAVPERAMGFCLLANVALAVRYLQQSYGIERVLIVDYDVHHGNGTQDIFYNEEGVLFVSTHQYPFYPGTGAFEETGAGNGVGHTINIPLPAGHGDASFASIYRDIIWPAAERYQPQFMVVSAGFDAHWNDPLARMALSLHGYAHITRELIRMADKLCGGKIVFVLEGGYDLKALAHGMSNVARALLGDKDVSDPYGPSPGREESYLKPILDRVRHIHSL